MSFANLKRQSGTNLDKLSAAIQALNTPSEGASDRENYWRPAVDKAGNGMATIRFLPVSEKDGDSAVPWVKIFSHGFQGPGGWLIDNCLTTKNKPCPVCEHNSTLWNSGIEANKDIVRKQKRKLNYIANVLIVSDPKNPENEGQIKLFKFGKKIFDKITEAMNPQFEDEVAVNPFDMWKGANFKLKIRKVEGYQNYDRSEFESSTVLSNDDAELELIWKKEFELGALVADSEFKEFDVLKLRLDKVLGLNGEAPRTTVEHTKVDTFNAKSSPKAAPKEPEIDEDEDEFTRFSKLADED